MTIDDAIVTLTADVLVIGGGPAGTWAAIKAAQAGADVVLADKGYCGSSGATAAVGTGVWYVDAGPERPRGGDGQPRGARRSPRRPRLDGPRARRDLREHAPSWPTCALPVPGRRRRPADPQRPAGPRVHAPACAPGCKRAGVRILDHSPALELLVDDDGAVSGAVAPSPARPAHRAHRGRRPWCSPPAAAPFSQGAGLRRPHRRRRPVGGRGGRGAVGHGVLQRLRHRARGHLGDQDRLLLAGPRSTAATARAIEGAGSARGPLGHRPDAR